MLRITPLVAAMTLCAVPAFAQDEGSSPPAETKRPTHAVGSSSSSSAPQVVSGTVKAQTVFSNIPGHPTAAIPGFPGFEFDAGTGSTHFDRPYGSPNGNWVLTAQSNDPSTSADEVYIVNGVGVLKEGGVAPWDITNNLGPFDTQIGINDAGDYIFCVNLAPVTTNDDYVIKVTGGSTFNVMAQEGSPTATLAGVTYDDTLDSAVLLGNGTVGFQADSIDGTGITTANDEILELGATLVYQQSVTVPGGQLVGSLTEAMEFFDFEDYWVDPAQTTILYQGDMTGPTATDDVVVVNNSVVLQEGAVIPGTTANPIDVSGIVGVSVDYGGNWYARGNNDIDEVDWVVRNGAVIALVGLAITPGSTELWDDTDFSDCFFAHTGNGVGDYVVAGVTSNDSVRNGVVVLNGTQVVVRENEPIDLDNDGLFNDGVYFSTFGNDDFILSDAGELHFTATFRDAAGTTVGQGFFKKNLSPCAGGPIDEFGVGCSGTSPVAPVLSGIGCATPGGALTIALTEGLPNSQAVLFIGLTQLAQNLGSGCTLYVNPLVPLALPLDANGSITFTANIPANSPLVTAVLQGFNADAGAPLGFTVSNGLSVTIQ